MLLLQGASQLPEILDLQIYLGKGNFFGTFNFEFWQLMPLEGKVHSVPHLKAPICF